MAEEVNRVEDGLAIRVYGDPKPAPRPRARHIKTKDGREFTTVYAGKGDKTWRAQVVSVAQRAGNIHDGLPFQNPLKVRMAFYLTRPKSVSARKRPSHTVKPDLDNLVKSVKDAMIGIIWRDDAQVVNLEASKSYDDAERPGVAISIAPILTAE